MGKTQAFLLGHKLEKDFYFAGSYIFIEASPRSPGDKAKLISDEIEPNGVVCV